jgi:hypothetical protein
MLANITDLCKGRHIRDHIISECNSEDDRGDVLLNKDLCQYMTCLIEIEYLLPRLELP